MAYQKFIFEGGLNTDDAEYLYPAGDWTNAKNIRITNVEQGKKGIIGFVTSTKQNIDSVNALSKYSGNFTCIGSYDDEANRTVYYFLYNDQNNFLVVSYNRNLDNGNGSPVTILVDNNNLAQDGTSIYKSMNFHKLIITGIAKVGNILAWTDNFNDIYKINVTRQLIGTSFAVHDRNYPKVSYENLTLIRRPPAFPLLLFRTLSSLIGVTNTANLISGFSFQFAYRYIYLDGEVSVLSPYSLLSPTSNLTGSMEPDVITVTIPFIENIPVDVLQIDVCVKIGNAGVFSVIKSWSISKDLLQINRHDAGSAELSFNFFNNQTGQALDPAYIEKPFDNIPLNAKCIEAAKNMFFVSNYTEGYNAPSTSSLSAVIIPDTLTITNAVGTWYLWRYQLTNSGHPIHTWQLLFVPGIDKWGYYFFSGYSDGTMPPYPSTLQLSNGIYYGQNADQIITTLEQIHGGYVYWYNLSVISPTENTTLSDTSVSNVSGRKEFKSFSSYQLGIVFYDNYLRNTGTITSDSLRISTPPVSFDPAGANANFIRYIQWSLSNANALAEIPEEAIYYSIVRTKNLTYTTFIPAECNQLSYYLGNGVDTPYKFDTFSDYAATFNGVAIDISTLDNNKMGYIYQKGDAVQVYIGTALPITLQIIGQYGTWVLCPLQNIGNMVVLNQGNNLFTIYTPYTPSYNEPFYEVGNMYSVSSPGTSTRSYSTTQGYLNGDITLLKRTNKKGGTYYAENMNADDNVYLNWDTDIGRINGVITQPGQIKNVNGARFSDQYIPETLINGLSSFYSLNQQNLPTEIGAVNKLQLTSKMQELGSVMLAIGQQGLVSIYIGETQVMQQTGNAFMEASENVIGSINKLKGDYGTLHPESVIEKNGQVFWYSILKKSICQYSINGVVPVSDNKLNSFLVNRSESILGLMNSGQLMNTPAVYDERNDEYVIYLPAVNPVNNGVMQPYIMEDGSAKTIGYNPKENRFTSPYDLYPELFASVGDVVLLFSKGIIYIQNGNTNGNNPPSPYNYFLGVQYNSSISKIINAGVPLVKNMQGITIESNIIPNYLQLVTYYVYEDGSAVYQMTDLESTELNWKEGIWYGTWFRDSLTPGQPSPFRALQTGDKMRGQWGYLLLQFNVIPQNGNYANLALNSCDVSYQISSGSKTIPSK